MTGSIYLLRDDDDLVQMNETSYDSEAVLQELLAKFPDLLAGDQLSGAEARRWLLIDRESRVPDEEGGAGRWSIDHLFLDQDGVPTLVEVKRSSDTGIRREVVGQLIDYAANAVVHWPIETLRTAFESRLERDGVDPESELAALLGPDSDVDEYWEQAGANLKAGRIRLVFVADRIPRELRRVVEFLNEQMAAEVIAVEVKQYVGPGNVRTLVPRVIGQTAAAETRKSTREKWRWDEASFFAELERNRGAAETQVARKLTEWSRVNLPRFAWGDNKAEGFLAPVLDHAGRNYWPFLLRTRGSIEIQFRSLKLIPPFDDEELRREFLRRLNEVPGISMTGGGVLSGRPRTRLAVLAADPEALELFLSALEWFCATARSVSGDDNAV